MNWIPMAIGAVIAPVVALALWTFIKWDFPAWDGFTRFVIVDMALIGAVIGWLPPFQRGRI